jgi:hypothetical protein
MDTTATEITEAIFQIYNPGVGRSRKNFTAPTRKALDRKVRNWLKKLDEDIVVDFPRGYELPDGIDG